MRFELVIPCHVGSNAILRNQPNQLMIEAPRYTTYFIMTPHTRVFWARSSDVSFPYTLLNIPLETRGMWMRFEHVNFISRWVLTTRIRIFHMLLNIYQEINSTINLSFWLIWLLDIKYNIRIEFCLICIVFLM